MLRRQFRPGQRDARHLRLSGMMTSVLLTPDGKTGHNRQ
jgi:hypothetical protein